MASPSEGREPERVVARFEMAITPADLQRLGRLLPGADRVRLEAMSASCEEPDGRRWHITVSNPRPRRFGLLSLPMADVEIEMTGYSQTESQVFLDRFHLVFRKGGG